MSYGITAYRVNLKAVEACLGGSDPVVRAKLRRACEVQSEEMDQWFSDEGPTFMEVVDELLDGKATHEYHGHLYWYAMEIVIDTLGQKLPNAHWYPCDWYSLGENCSHLYPYSGLGPGFIPMPDDFPLVSVIYFDKLGEWDTNCLEGIYEPEQIREFKSWILESQLHSQDLVLYVY